MDFWYYSQIFVSYASFSDVSHHSMSVTIVTKNEAENIERAIRSVQWADEVLVVDCGSTDQTVEIAKKLGARVIFHEWQGYGKQKNFAQEQARNPWVLNIDADEEVSEPLAQEIQKALASPNGSKGFSMPRKTRYLGRWILHGGWYPNRLVRLAHKGHAQWTEPHVHEALEVKGEVSELAHPLLHFTFRNIEHQILTNLRYSKEGHQQLLRRGVKKNVFMLLWKPVSKFLETYVIKRGFMDGLPGFIISVNAAHSIFLKYAYFFEKQTDANTHHR